MADYLSGDPDATAFRYTSVRFTSFGMAWFFENFDKGAASYLGETLTYTASRNCDIHEMTLFRYELPGIGNFLYNSSTLYEVVHDELCAQYYQMSNGNEAASLVYGESFFQASDTTNFKRRSEGQPYYTDGVALAAVKGVEYKVGGQRMDRHDKYALYTWIMLNSGSIGVPFDMCGLAQNTGNRNKELKAASMAFQVKYCPLIFSFCRAPSMGAPLISNMYNNLIIEAEFEPFSAVICNFSGTGFLNGASATTAVTVHTTLTTGASSSPIDLAFNGAPNVAVAVALSATTQAYTLKRVNETSQTAAYARGRDLITAATQGASSVSATNLAQTDFPVSVVSRVFFLGPEERTAFASNSFSQTVEACQRVKLSASGGQTSQTYRTDTFQNASSVMYVVPTYKPNLAANDYFSAGGSYDLARGTTFPAINTLELSTNGATLYAQSDESFYRMVQPYAHHSNVLDPGRRVYAFNFGTRANSRGPVQAIGYLNFSRTTNSQVTATHPANLWAGDASVGNLAATSTINLDMEFILWNYNLLTYKGGIAGYRYTQSNNSL